MECVYAPKMPDWQFGLGLNGVGQRRAFIYELFQKRIYGNALSPSFVSKASLGFARNFDTHGTALFFRMAGMDYNRASPKNQNTLSVAPIGEGGLHGLVERFLLLYCKHRGFERVHAFANRLNRFK